MIYCPHEKHKVGEELRGERSAGRPEVVRPRGKGMPLAGAHLPWEAVVFAPKARVGAHYATENGHGKAIEMRRLRFPRY